MLVHLESTSTSTSSPMVVHVLLWLNSSLQLAQLRDKSSGEVQSPLPLAWRGIYVFYGIQLLIDQPSEAAHELSGGRHNWFDVFLIATGAGTDQSGGNASAKALHGERHSEGVSNQWQGRSRRCYPLAERAAPGPPISQH